VHGTRLLSALTLLALVLLVVLYGGEEGFALLAMVVTGIGLWEFTRLVAHASGDGPPVAVPGAIALVAAAYGGGLEWFGLGAVLLLLAELSRIVAKPGEMDASLRRAALSFLGAIYVAGPFSVAVVLRGMPYGERYILLACSIVWAGDTAAFYVGSGLGRNPLAPQVSPRKSVEGGVGGLIASMGTAWALARAMGFPVSALSGILLGALVGMAGQMGDLIESVIKRSFQVKDTGRLIPGHGGMLDRIDSLLFAIPVFYLWVWLGWI
jgi:phosphatidate cytidylyltransferase